MRLKVAASAGKRITSPATGARPAGRTCLRAAACRASFAVARDQSRETRGATANPCSANSMAGRNRRASGMLPWSAQSRHQPSTAPGMVTACTLVVSRLLMPFLPYQSAVAAAGARPAALRASGFFAPGLAISAKQSPPMPVIGHSTTASTAAVAIAASTALPPWRRISTAARLAAGCEVRTLPVARKPGSGQESESCALCYRRGKGLGLIAGDTQGKAEAAQVLLQLPAALNEFHDHGIDRQAVARLGPDRLHDPLALGAQHVFHFHRLDDAERIARLDLLAHHDMDGLDQARHRTDQQLGGVRCQLRGHQIGELSLQRGINVGLGAHAAVGKVVAVEEAPNLHRDRAPLDGALPNRFTRPPRGVELESLARGAIWLKHGDLGGA